MATIEAILTQHDRITGIAGAVRSVADRTRDMIPAVLRVFEYLHPDIPIGDIGDRTMTRLELGVPAELAELGGALGTRLSRAQYLALLADHLSDPNSFLNAETTRLTELLAISETQAKDFQAQVRKQKQQSMDTVMPLLPPPAE